MELLYEIIIDEISDHIKHAKEEVNRLQNNFSPFNRNRIVNLYDKINKLKEIRSEFRHLFKILSDTI